jgi:hypothetical protein
MGFSADLAQDSRNYLIRSLVPGCLVSPLDSIKRPH